jgi:hypothetical protein
MHLNGRHQILGDLTEIRLRQGHERPKPPGGWARVFALKFLGFAPS